MSSNPAGSGDEVAEEATEGPAPDENTDTRAATDDDPDADPGNMSARDARSGSGDPVSEGSNGPGGDPDADPGEKSPR